MLYHLIAEDKITGAALEWEIATVADDETKVWPRGQVLKYLASKSASVRINGNDLRKRPHKPSIVVRWAA
jgi:hypothetical protein